MAFWVQEVTVIGMEYFIPMSDPQVRAPKNHRTGAMIKNGQSAY